MSKEIRSEHKAFYLKVIGEMDRVCDLLMLDEPDSCKAFMKLSKENNSYFDAALSCIALAKLHMELMEAKMPSHIKEQFRENILDHMTNPTLFLHEASDQPIALVSSPDGLKAINADQFMKLTQEVIEKARKGSKTESKSKFEDI